MTVIAFASQHVLTRGYMHGLQQTGLCIEVQVQQSIGGDLDLDGFDRWMESCLGGDTLPLVQPQHVVDPVLSRCIAWSLVLQRNVRLPVSERFACLPKPVHGDSPQAARPFLAVVPCVTVEASLDSLQFVARCLQRWLDEGAPPDGDVATDDAFEAVLARLRSMVRWGVNDFYLAVAAHAMDLPVRSMLPRVLQLGVGRNSRWFMSSITDRTSTIGVKIAKQKDWTASFLRQAGLPGAQNEAADSAEAAVQIAERLAWPVVIKPADKEQGQGVAADIRDAQVLRKAWQDAREVSSHVLVEKHFDGHTHRLTVFNGRVLRVVKRTAGGIVGDGLHTIAQLVQAAQADPLMKRRSAMKGRVLLAMDEEALSLLSQYGLGADSVPAPGQQVRLRRRDNFNAGGTNEVLSLDQVHPDNQALALRAAALLRLDFAGIDLIIADIEHSWLTSGALICEVNAQPQMGSKEQSNLYRDFLAEAVPGNGRVPLHLVMTTAEATQLPSVADAAIKRWPAAAVSHVGGVWLEGKQVAGRFRDGFEAARAALAQPDLHGLLMIMQVAEVVRWGLPIERIDRVSVLNAAAPSPEVERGIHRAMGVIAQHVGGHVPAI